MMNATMLQMMRSYPSTIAPILDGDWRDTTEPVQFEYRGRRLAVGSIVHKQKLSGVKKLNLSAADEQFEQLLIAAALMANAEGDINLVCGFPKHTIAQNTQLLKTYKNRRFEVPTPNGARVFTIRSIWPMYEAVGHAHGVRYALGIREQLFVASIGFGTVEAVLLDTEGRPVMSTMFGEKLGIRRAVEIFKGWLLKDGLREPDCGGDDAWYDSILISAYRKERQALRVGSQIASVEWLHELALKALETYASSLLAPRILQHIDSIGAGGVLFPITGGGSLYREVAQGVKAMAESYGLSFREIPEDLSLKSAALGYAVLAKTREEFSSQTLIADFGNSNTVYSFMI